jgi:solute carrier family 25 iron transporter 28/37
MVSDVHASTIELEWEEWHRDVPFWRHAVAGSCAGVAEHIAMFPLDTVKTRLQAFSGGSSVRQVVRDIVRENGWKGFLRGWTAIASGCVPAHIALFTVYENSKAYLSTAEGGLTDFNAALCGGLATLAHDSILTPMDVVKQRLQLGCYSGVADCIRKVVKSEGYGSLFRSLPTTLMINAPYGSIFVLLNERLKASEMFSGETLTTHFATAGIAAGLASIATHPLDVVKTRLQTQDVLCKGGSCHLKRNAHVKYPSFRIAVATMWSEEGIRGFYRGLVPRTLLSVPAAATCWGTYESVKAFLKKVDSVEYWSSLVKLAL